MKITCPGYNTSYAVAADSVSGDGRKVRCARCGSVWHAVAYLPDADILRPESDEATTARASRAARRVARNLFRRFPGFDKSARHAAEKAMNGLRIGFEFGKSAIGDRGRLACAVGVVLVIEIAAIHYREDVVRSLPAAAGIYDLVGLPVNLRGLEFVNVAQRREFEDGVPFLIVEGDILNIEQDPAAVPALRFALRGANGEELRSWTVEPPQRAVASNGAMKFRTRLASPPQGADDVMIRFTERTNRFAEYRN